MFRRIKANMKAGSSRITSFLPPFFFFCVLLIAWETIVSIFKVPAYLVPRPLSVFATIMKNFAALIKDTGITLFEAICGFLLGALIGFLIAVLFAHSRPIESSVYPYFVALQSVPIVAIAPLLVLWFGNGLAGKIIMSSIVCFFPVVINMTIGLRSADKEIFNLLKLMGATRLQIFKVLSLPSSLPFLMSALKISASLSIIGAIVAEIAGARQGIGFRIVVSSYQTDTKMMFAAIVFAALAGIGFFKTIGIIEKKVLFWHISTK